MSDEVKSLTQDFAGLLQGLAIEEAFYRHSFKVPYLFKQDMGTANFLSITTNDYIFIDDSTVPNFRALYTFICIFDSVTPKHRANILGQQEKSKKQGLLIDFVLVDLEKGTYENLSGGKMTDKKLRKALEKALLLQSDSDKNIREIGAKAEERAYKKAKELRSPGKLYIFSPIMILVIINIVIFFAGSDSFVEWGILSGEKVKQGEIWRLFTAMFLHADMAHLFGNMYFLTMLGRALVNKYSNTKLIFVYLTSGVAGCILSAAFSEGMSLGASGAIMGLGGVILCKLFFDENRRYYRQGNLYAHLAVMIIFNLFYGLFNTGIDNYGHFGGFICGFLLELLFIHIKSKKQA